MSPWLGVLHEGAWAFVSRSWPAPLRTPQSTRIRPGTSRPAACPPPSTPASRAGHAGRPPRARMQARSRSAPLRRTAGALQQGDSSRLGTAPPVGPRTRICAARCQTCAPPAHLRHTPRRPLEASLQVSALSQRSSPCAGRKTSRRTCASHVRRCGCQGTCRIGSCH